MKRKIPVLPSVMVATVIWLLGGESRADPGAGLVCPPWSFLNPTNLAANASFETVGPVGTPASAPSGTPWLTPSAAHSWFMHTDNFQAPVMTELVTTAVPGPGGHRVLHVISGGNEGGVYQLTNLPPQRLMFSAWVRVRRGKVQIQAQGGTTGPASMSTKIGEWEQLRVCTDGTVPNDLLLIYNQDPAGGDFVVDRVEVRAIP